MNISMNEKKMLDINNYIVQWKINIIIIQISDYCYFLWHFQLKKYLIKKWIIFRRMLAATDKVRELV